MTPSFNLDPALLAILVCPACHASLEPTGDELRLHRLRPGLPRSATTSRCCSVDEARKPG